MLARTSFIVLCLLVCGTACSEPAPAPPPGSRHVTISTDDGERLDAVEAGSGDRVAVLSHGATGTKEDFYDLLSAYADAGWKAVAYDARGVGDSSGSSGEHRAVDLRAVVSFERDQGAGSLVLVGGSLGGALSLSMARELKADAVISLSAPADVFGALAAAGDLRDAIPVMVAAAEDNQPYADGARAIADAAGVRPIIVSGAGHGSGMFVDHPELIRSVVRFSTRST